MSAALRLREGIAEKRTTLGVLALTLAVHLVVLVAVGLRSGLDMSGYRAPPQPIYMRIEPRPLMPGEIVREPPLVEIQPPSEAPALSRAAQTLALRERLEDEEERERLEALRLPIRPAPRDQGIEPRWEVQAEETTADRVARALQGAALGCNRPRSEMTEAERARCDGRFDGARPAPGIRGSGDAQRDAVLERQGRANRAQWEAQRAPLPGGTGLVGPGDCPGSNLGMGCAGAHQREIPGVDMRQGAETPIRQRSNRPPAD